MELRKALLTSLNPIWNLNFKFNKIKVLKMVTMACRRTVNGNDTLIFTRR